LEIQHCAGFEGKEVGDYSTSNELNPVHTFMIMGLIRLFLLFMIPLQIVLM